MSKLFKRSASSASIKPQQSLGTGNDQESIVTDDSRLPTERKVSKSMSMRFGPKRRSSTASSVVVNDGNDTASSIRGDEESDSPRRKNTIGHKTKHRLSSMFNKPSSRSRTVSTDNTSPSTPTHESPSPPTSTLEPSEVPPKARPPPAPSSGLNTPTKMGAKTPVTRKEVSNKGETVSAEEIGQKLRAVSLNSTSPGGLAPPIPLNLTGLSIGNGLVTDEPIQMSPAQASPSSALSSSNPPFAQRTRDRSDSTYSQWDYEFNADSDSEGEVYGTPDEGLSEVEEGDEEEETARPVKPIEEAHRSAEEIVEREIEDVRSTNGMAGSSDVPGKMTQSEKKTPEMPRHLSSAVIERATVSSQPDMSRGPRVQSHNPSAYTDLNQEAVLQPDIQKCKEIIHLFLTSRMKQAESVCQESDPDGVHMYIGNASAVIQAIKAMMTFDTEDLKDALEIAKTTSALSNSLRKPAGSVAGRLAGFVRDRSGVGHVRGMNVVEKHAELVYAETLLIKAVLGIVAGGDWVGLIKEALNMRTAYGIYRTLQTYLETSNDQTLDEHFKSGVQLGSGLSSLMLSLLPSKVMKVAELLGYSGDRKSALVTLMSAGGWTAGRSEPAISAEDDGVRRPICDMALLAFHLVISFLMPVAGVDVHLAQNILDWNMKRFPDGIFFLYFQSRLLTLQAQPEKANDVLQKALMMKLEYLQLQHICLWDLGVNNLMLCQFKRSRGCFKILADESSWSKAAYMYSEAACLAELSSGDEPFEEDELLHSIMQEVPKNMRRIAGKSLPIEKFVSRKARKFVSQGNRLMLPAIELGYFFGALPNTPPKIIYDKLMPRIQNKIKKITASDEHLYEGGQGYWDDYCLAHFLLGTALSFAAYPHEEAIISAEDAASYPISQAEANRQAEEALNATLANSSKITLDHWIPYFTHYELARLCSQQNKQEDAKHHLSLILSGKPLETAPTGEKHGKYSLENALMLKAYSGMQTLKENPNAKMH